MNGKKLKIEIKAEITQFKVNKIQTKKNQITHFDLLNLINYIKQQR